MCVCANDLGWGKRASKAVFLALAVAICCGAGLYLLKWSDQHRPPSIYRFEEPSILAALGASVFAFWSTLGILYFMTVRKSPGRLRAEYGVRRAQEKLYVRRFLLGRSVRRVG
jgi:hypothetical protein